MEIRLRTLIFSAMVEIQNVPVQSCQQCRKSIVCPEVKPDLKELINSLGPEPRQQKFDFADYNEYANLLRMISDGNQLDMPIDEWIEERINQLLDLMLVARSAHDKRWLEELEKKLSQITKHRNLIDVFPG
jgi:hypothetical protein